jgi:stage III sporulation protein AB
MEAKAMREILRLLISIVILASTTSIGVLKANTYKQRVSELRLLQMLIQNLETEIVYSYTPLAEAFYSITANVDNSIAKIFVDSADMIELREGKSFKNIWQQSLDNNIGYTCLTKEDTEVLGVLGRTLGQSDEDNQKKHIKLVMEKLKHAEKRAEEAKMKNEKLYKSLGFISGAIIVILLF